MKIFNLEHTPTERSNFGKHYERLVKSNLLQSVDILAILDDIHTVEENELYLYSKNEKGDINGILTGIHFGNFGYVGYLLTDDNLSVEQDAELVFKLLEEAEKEFKLKSNKLGEEYKGTFTEVISYYEDEDYVCAYSPDLAEKEQLTMVKNKFFPMNVEYVEPSMEHGVVDQYMFLFFKKGSSNTTMKVYELYDYIRQIYETIYELDSDMLEEYMKWIKESSELNEDFYVEFHQIPKLPRYSLYELGENPY